MMEPKVTVIIPTVGTRALRRCVESALMQTVPCKVLVVLDGVRFVHRVPTDIINRVQLIVLPENTGGKRADTGVQMNGHMIYAAASYLSTTRYVAFLDEDNWYEPDHVEKCMRLVEQGDLQWACSLRNIRDAANEDAFVCVDNCESLGTIRKAFDRDEYLVDTSCMFLRRDVAMAVSPSWNQSVTADRTVTAHLVRDFPRGACTMAATVNYSFKEPDNRKQALAYFLKGNDRTKSLFHEHPTVYVACPESHGWVLGQIYPEGVNFLPARADVPWGATLLVVATRHGEVPYDLLRTRPDLKKTLAIPCAPSRSNCYLWDAAAFFDVVLASWVPYVKRIGNGSLKEFVPPFLAKPPVAKRDPAPCILLDGSVSLEPDEFVIRDIAIRCKPFDPSDHPGAVVYTTDMKQALEKGYSMMPEDIMDVLAKHASCIVPQISDAEGCQNPLHYACLAAGTRPIH
jgi:hypothetical protein